MREIERKSVRKEHLEKKKEKRFKLNKLILYVLFKLVLFVYLYYTRTKKLNICKILIIFGFLNTLPIF